MTNSPTSSKVNWPSLHLLIAALASIAASIWHANIWLQGGLALVALVAFAKQQQGQQRQQQMLEKLETSHAMLSTAKLKTASLTLVKSMR